MNIFITGATGFVGKAFLKELLSRKDIDFEKIFLLQREKNEYSDRRIVVLEGDLLKINDYKKEILSSSYVFHVAANATFGSGIDYDIVNFSPTKKIVDILKKSKLLKDFIFTSTIGAVDRCPKDKVSFPLNVDSIPCPTSDYGRSKLKSEEYIIKSKIPFTIIRPTWVYGRDMRLGSHINKFVSIINKSAWFAYFNFPGKVSLIHVDDLAFSLTECINNKNAINKIFFAETEDLSLGNILKEIYKKLYRKKIKQISFPKFKIVLSHIHSHIPLLLNNLFIDYLFASDKSYKELLLKGRKTIKFKDGVMDVIETNVDLNGYWVVTGANSGIGYSIATLLNKKGKRTILIDKNTENLSVFNEQFILKCDLSKTEDLNKIASFLSDKKIYCLINNAGVGLKKKLFDMTTEEVNLMIDVNVKAELLLCVLLKKNLTNNHSTIVNIGSSAGYNPLPGMSVYAATKALVINLTRSLIEENMGKNKVILFSPSGTATNFQKSAGVYSDPKKQGLLNPNDVALKIVSAVEKGKSKEILLGLKSKVLVVFGKIVPSSLNTKVQGFLFKILR